MTSGKRIAVWDGWRGLAILLVLIGHFTFSSWTNVAWVLLCIYLLSVAINIHNYLNLSALEFEYSLIRTESAIGFIAFSAAYHLLRNRYSIIVHPQLPLLLFLLALACYVRVAPIWLTFLLGPVFLGIAVNHLVDAAKSFHSLLMFAPLRWLGILSYSIYLWQQIFYKLYYALPGGAISGFVLSVLVGAGSFYIIETPLRKAINNRWSNVPTYRNQGTGLKTHTP